MARSIPQNLKGSRYKEITLACMLRHADTYIRQILMTLLPHKALTTLIRFQKRLRLHIVENEEKYFCLRHHFSASSLVHTKTP